MVTLIRGAHIFAPDDLGIGDILLAHGKILHVAKRIDEGRMSVLGPVNIVDADGLSAIAGLMDMHLHFLGGAGSGGLVGCCLQGLKAGIGGYSLPGASEGSGSHWTEGQRDPR